jgi:hypothetical protein
LKKGDGLRDRGPAIVRRFYSLLIGVLIGLTLAACAQPYRSPVIVREPGQQPTANFPGLKDLIIQGAGTDAPAQALWTHGMCSHDQQWAYDRINRLEAVLGVPAIIRPPYAEGDQPYYINATFNTPAGSLTVTFLIWSPMTRSYKASLDFDKPGPNGDTNFPYTRATLNGELKTTLMNDCLSDAVIYAGKNGDPIRGAMRQAVCNFLGGVITTQQGVSACDLSGAKLDRPTAIVTESLGSKFIFDAVRTVWDEGQRAPVRQAGLQRRLSAISTVYLVSNQIPLLDLANPIPSAGSSLARFVAISNGRRRVNKVSALTIVDFSDPNDLLSYRLLPTTLDVRAAELVNVTVSNDNTYFGFLERPDTAHCGYAWNRDVIGMIASGYRAGEPLPTAPPFKSGQCL